MPMNSQMKDVDLFLMNITKKKSVSIQVKWSRAYEPKKSEIEKYGDGSAGRFFLKKDTIQKSTADYFIFLIYVIYEKSKLGRRIIEPHTITIPTKKLKQLCLKYKTPHPDRYSFYFRINPKKKIAFDFREEKKGGKYDTKMRITTISWIPFKVMPDMYKMIERSMLQVNGNHFGYEGMQLSEIGRASCREGV